MWSGCHPKTESELQECETLGKSLSRMSQPTILSILAEAQGEPLHGYRIVKLAAGYPMFGGKKPDAAGIYRTLKKMGEAGLVDANWDTPETGAAKRMFTLTERGYDCLRRWIDALACYCTTIQELRVMASEALGIELPDTPVCHAPLEYEQEWEGEAEGEALEEGTDESSLGQSTAEADEQLPEQQAAEADEQPADEPAAEPDDEPAKQQADDQQPEQPADEQQQPEDPTPEQTDGAES